MNYIIPNKERVITPTSQTNVMIITQLPETKSEKEDRFEYIHGQKETEEVGDYSLEEMHKIRQDFIVNYHNFRKYPKMIDKDWE